MLFRQAGQFPFCDHYLQYFLSPDLLKQRPKVWNAFRDVCENESLAVQGLTYGKGPLVYIGCPPTGIAGRYWSKQKTVFIHPNIALLYEKHRHRQPRVWEDAKARYGWFDWLPWEATVLHEIVHWARDMGGKSEDYTLSDSARYGTEAGKVFEKKAYDRVIQSGATKGEASTCDFEPTPPWRGAAPSG